MSSNCQVPFQTDPVVNGGMPVFAGTKVSVHDFIDWMMQGGRLSEFLAENPEVTRQHIRDYLLSALPEKILGYGETREWAQ